MMGLSDRYLQRIFAAHNETCSEVLRDRRIREARLLLGSRRSSGIMVSQVGYAVGFSDPAHFSRVFRNSVGCAPRDYGSA
ncbi:helix-turn-helix transcriptional regulator [Sphingopyxis indica]|nr:helix-turn-helix transcriptional regulator [Sphingopyxis indica]